MRLRLIDSLLWRWKTQLDKRMTYYVVDNEHVIERVCINENNKEENIHISFVIGRNAVLDCEIVIAHTSVSVFIECVLADELARADIRCAYIGVESNSIAIETLQHHRKHLTNSRLLVKGVLYDTAQSCHSGMVRVDTSARQSVSSQEHKTLLLSEFSRALSIPSLEVKTDDVKCFHGSAVGRFNDEHLFYAAARGINKDNAGKLLLKAFFSDVVSDETIEKYIVIR